MIQAKINEAISDVAEPNVKVRYWPLSVLFGRPESEEGLKEAEDTLQAGADISGLGGFFRVCLATQYLRSCFSL